MNNDYENLSKDPPASTLNKKTLKGILYINTFLKYFSIIIILFLLMSYISKKYIPGIGMNFFPMFIPIGKLFFSKLCLTSLFHPPLSPQELSQSNFFKQNNLSSPNSSKNIPYYELINLGASLKNIIQGITTTYPTTTQKNIETSKIYIVNYNDPDHYWYQKLILIIFGAIQMIIGTATTLFGSFAYLFGSKHGYFLNLPKEKEILESKKEDEFVDVGLSLLKEDSDKIVIKSGFTKFSAFFNYLFFIPVDKLSYGTSYFIRNKQPPFMNRLKYFFFITFIIIIISILSYSYQSTSISIGYAVISFLVLFILFATRILNMNYEGDGNPDDPSLLPFSNYESMFVKMKSYDSNIKTFDQMAKAVQDTKDDLIRAVSDYKSKAKGDANVSDMEELKIKLPEQVAGRLKVKEKYKKNIEKLRTEFLHKSS